MEMPQAHRNPTNDSHAHRLYPRAMPYQGTKTSAAAAVPTITMEVTQLIGARSHRAAVISFCICDLPLAVGDQAAPAMKSG